MSGYEHMKMRMRTCGSTIREENIANSKYLLEQTFADDPSYKASGVSILYSDRVIYPRIYNHKNKESSPAQCEIQTLYSDPFYTGDVMNLGNDKYWLCIDVNDLNTIQWEGKLLFCNYRIKFLSPLDGTTRTYPVSIYNASQYGVGETSKSVMTVGSVGLVIYIPYDSHTVLIDNGKRFMLDKNTINPTVFKCTQADPITFADGAYGTMHGYIKLYLSEDEYNSKTDDKTNMIADAYVDAEGSAKELDTDPSKWL